MIAVASQVSLSSYHNETAPHRTEKLACTLSNEQPKGTMSNTMGRGSPVANQAVVGLTQAAPQAKPPSLPPDSSGTEKKSNMPSGAVLTENDVLEIFLQRPKRVLDSSGKNTFVADSEAKPTLLAQQFQVASKTIRDIWNRNTWVRTTKPHWNAAELAAAGEKVEGAENIVAAQVRKRGRPSGAKDALPRTRTCKKKMSEPDSKPQTQFTSPNHIHGLLLASNAVANSAHVAAQHGLPGDPWDVHNQTVANTSWVAPSQWTTHSQEQMAGQQHSWLPQQVSISDASLMSAHVIGSGGAGGLQSSWRNEDTKLAAVEMAGTAHDWGQQQQHQQQQHMQPDQQQGAFSQHGLGARAALVPQGLQPVSQGLRPVSQAPQSQMHQASHQAWGTDASAQFSGSCQPASLPFSFSDLKAAQPPTSFADLKTHPVASFAELKEQPPAPSSALSQPRQVNHPSNHQWWDHTAQEVAAAASLNKIRTGPPLVFGQDRAPFPAVADSAIPDNVQAGPLHAASFADPGVGLPRYNPMPGQWPPQGF